MTCPKSQWLTWSQGCVSPPLQNTMKTRVRRGRVESVKHPRVSNQALPGLSLGQPLPLAPRLLSGLGPHQHPLPTPSRPTAGRRHRWQARVRPPARLTQLSSWRARSISSHGFEQLGASQPGPSCSLSLVQGSGRPTLLRPWPLGRGAETQTPSTAELNRTSEDTGSNITSYRWGN